MIVGLIRKLADLAAILFVALMTAAYAAMRGPPKETQAWGQVDPEELDYLGLIPVEDDPTLES